VFVDASSEVLQKEKAEAFYKEQKRDEKELCGGRFVENDGRMEEWRAMEKRKKERRKKRGGKAAGQPSSTPRKTDNGQDPEMGLRTPRRAPGRELY